ncbi:MAG: hypothetical protein BGO90_09845 [Legionella sp. 40-6]|nr:hypothetical protein [Legionella sp.]OJY12113.1 MAG: hypothetical protein BGO90_09845 [Legionella sp. 40-6]
MPFNIEVTAGKVAVKIQVFKKVINVYFNGDPDEAFELRDKWGSLSKSFLDRPYVGNENGLFIPSGIYHQKKEHTYAQERKIVHLHNTFLVEVTPDIFADYINEIYRQQLSKKSAFKFFQNPEQVKYIIDAFKTYYENYKGSPLEQDIEEETKLTFDEQLDHEDDIRQAKREQERTRLLMQTLLGPSTPNLFNHKKVSPSTIVELNEDNSEVELEEEDQSSCNIM